MDLIKVYLLLCKAWDFIKKNLCGSNTCRHKLRGMAFHPEHKGNFPFEEFSFSLYKNHFSLPVFDSSQDKKCNVVWGRPFFKRRHILDRSLRTYEKYTLKVGTFSISTWEIDFLFTFIVMFSVQYISDSWRETYLV